MSKNYMQFRSTNGIDLEILVEKLEKSEDSHALIVLNFINIIKFTDEPFEFNVFVNYWPDWSSIFVLRKPKSLAHSFGTIYSKNVSHLKKMLEHIWADFGYDFVYFVGPMPKPCVKVLQNFYRSKGKPFEIVHTTSMAAIPNYKWGEVLSVPEEPNLPPEYGLSTLKPSETEYVMSFWEYRLKDGLESFRNGIKQLPNSCVRLKEDGSLVAWEILNPVGMMTHLYSIKEHRRKGLGRIVELDLARKMIQLGLHPYKVLEMKAEDAVAITVNSPYWIIESTKYVSWKWNLLQS